MATCRHCNKETDTLYRLENQVKATACQGCYNYLKNGGTINPLPHAGCIEYDAHGKVVCHICGRAYTRLGSHIKESHHMTIAEYKEIYGLCKRTKTTEKSYSNMMHDYALENNMDLQLKETGGDTRIKKGDTNKRKGKKICLQEYLEIRFNKKLGKTREDYLNYMKEDNDHGNQLD